MSSSANRERLMQVLLGPHISEKATSLAESGQVVFKVRSDATKTDVRKAVELYPNDGDIADNYAQLLRQKGEPVAAARVYEAIGEAIANNWRAVGNRALLLQDLSRYESAEGLFRRALAMKPDYALAHANLLFCLNYHPDRSAEETRPAATALPGPIPH